MKGLSLKRKIKNAIEKIDKSMIVIKENCPLDLKKLASRSKKSSYLEKMLLIDRKNPS